MADQSSNLATLRLGGHGAFCYLSVYKPDPVAQGTLTATPASGATALAVTYTVGSESNTRQGFYIRFYDTGTGVFKGDSRVRNSGARTSSSLPVRELAYGHAKLASGDTFKVYPYVQPDTKLIDASAAFNPDGETYSDEGLHPAPIVNFGSHYAGWADATTGVALVTGKGSTSFLVDPTSSTPVSHFTSGSSGIAFHTGSSNTDANPVIEASPGMQWVEHIGSDNDNGRSATNFLAYMVHDSTHLPLEVFLPTPPTGDPVNGWSWTVELISSADIESIWDGALCVLWVDEYIAGVKQSFRGNNDDRSHILGIGYARRDTSTGNAQDGDRITFEIQSPISRFAEIASYSKVIQEATTPTDWSGVNTLGVKRALIKLIRDYTFLQEAGYDFFVHSLYSDARYPAFYIQRSDVIGQIRELAEGRKARFVNKLRGAAFELQPHPAYLSMTDRASVTVNSTLTSDDVIGYSVTRDHQDSVEIFELQGITAGTSGNSSVYSRFPGLSPAGGKQYTTQGRYIPDSQSSNNADCAMMGAFAQQIFIDSNHSNAKHRVGEMTLDLPGAYGYFDFELEYTKFNYASDLRGVDYNSFRAWLKRFQTTVDESTGEWAYQAVFQQETGAPSDAAKTFDPQNPVTTPLPAPQLPSFNPVTLPTLLPGLIGRGENSMALICANGLAETGNFQRSAAAGGPNYAYTSWATIGATGTVLQWCPDGFTPGSGWIVTTVELGYLDLSSLTYTVKHTFGATSSFRSVDASFAESGFMAVSSYYPSGGGTKVLHTVDNSSFTETVVNSDDGAATTGGGCYVSSKTAGKIVVAAQTSSTTTVAYVSTDHGATWATLSPAFHASRTGFFHIHAPWNSNPSDNIYYYASNNATSNEAVWRNVGATITDVSPTIGGNKFTPVVQRNGIDSYVGNRQRMICVGEQDSGSFSVVAAFLSNNAGDTWPTTILSDTDLRACALSGDDGNQGWIWGTNNKIYALTIAGTTVTTDSRTGDLASFSPGTIIAIAGIP